MVSIHLLNCKESTTKLACVQTPITRTNYINIILSTKSVNKTPVRNSENFLKIRKTFLEILKLV